MPRNHGALVASDVLLRIFRIFNIGVAVLMVLALPASFLFEQTFFEFFSKKPPRIDSTWLLPALRIWLVSGVALLAAVHVLFSRLLALVETVRAGDPFVPENAGRLKTIAWCLLACQVFNLLSGVLSATINAAGSNIDWKFNLTGWLSVALTFVLAWVFEEGTRMRDDLERVI